MTICKSCKWLFTPQVNGDLLEPELILAVAECKIQDFLQLFIEIQMKVSIICAP